MLNNENNEIPAKRKAIEQEWKLIPAPNDIILQNDKKDPDNKDEIMS